MIRIYQMQLDKIEPNVFLKNIKDKTVPILTSVHLITPTKVGREADQVFGGRELKDGKLVITRIKFFFMRWLPKLVLELKRLN